MGPVGLSNYIICTQSKTYDDSIPPPPPPPPPPPTDLTDKDLWKSNLDTDAILEKLWMFTWVSYFYSS